MSKWTDIRDSITGVLKVDEVTEELKEKVSQAVLDEVLPPIESVVDDFTGKLKEQAPQESGWCRARDGIVLPLVMQGAVYIVKFVLTKTLTSTTPAAQTGTQVE